MDIGGASFKITAAVVGQAQVDNMNASLKKADVTIGGVTKSAKQMSNEMRQLAPQFTDIVTQLAGGQSPFLILLQQGGQIKDIFGGIRPALAAIATLITPMTVAIGALGGTVGALGLAAYKGAEEISGLNRSMLLSGGYAGQTQSSYERLKKTVSDLGNVSAGTARELVSGAVASAAFGPALIAPAATAMAKIKSLSGQTSDDVVKDFASMRNGVARWAEEHNKQYNYLTAAEYRHIEQLEKQGKLEEAMKLNIDLLNKAFQDRTEQLGYLQTAWDKLGKAASSAWDYMLGIGRPETPEERIAKLTKQIEANKQTLKDLEDVNNGAGIFKQDTSQARAIAQQRIDAANAEIAAIREKAKAQQEAADAKAKEDAENQKGIEREKERPKIEAANAQLSIQIAQNEAQQRIAAYELEEAGIDRLRKMGFLSEEEAAKRIGDIKADKIRANIALAQTELSVERAKKADSDAEVITKSARVAAIEGKIANLNAQIKVTEAQAQAEAAGALETAAKAFDEFQKATKKQIGKLTAENGVEAAKLIKDPILRQRAELDAEIDKIREKYNEIIIPIKLKLETASGDEAKQLQEDIDKLNEQMNRAIDIKRQGTVDINDQFAGIREGIKKIAEDAEDRASAIKNVLVNAFDGAADALTKFATTGKADFRGLAQSILADLTKMIIKQTLFNTLAGVFGGGTSAASGTSAGTASVATYAANGMAFGGTHAFASGGVVNSATPFRFANGGAIQNGLMGEAGPEAIMPLKRGKDGKLGVVAGGAGGVNIAITVNADKGSAQSSSNDKAGQLGSAIATAVQQEIMKQKRPGGLLAA